MMTQRGLTRLFVYGYVAQYLEAAESDERVISGESWFARPFLEIADRRGTQLGVSSERIHELEPLLGMGGKVLFHPGGVESDHPCHVDTEFHRRTGAYPHDLAGLAQFRNLFPEAVYTIEEGGFAVEQMRGSSLITTGSPYSNRQASKLLPHRYLRRDGRLSDAESPRLDADVVKYHFVVDERAGQTVEVVSAMSGGETRLKMQKAISWLRGTERMLYKPQYYTKPDRKLRTDFLLVSRLPISPAGGDAIILAGAHGAATQAAELLFSNEAFSKSDVDFLRTALGPRPQHYQFIVEVHEIEHTRTTTVGHRLKLVRDEPPPTRLTIGMDRHKSEGGS